MRLGRLALLGVLGLAATLVVLTVLWTGSPEGGRPPRDPGDAGDDAKGPSSRQRRRLEPGEATSARRHGEPGTGAGGDTRPPPPLDRSSVTARVLGANEERPPAEFRGSAVRWRFSRGLDTESRKAMLAEYAHLTREERLELLREIGRERAVEVVDEVVACERLVAPVPTEAVVYTRTLTRLLDRGCPRSVSDPTSTDDSALAGIERWKSVMEVLLRAPVPMLEDFHGVAGDATWEPIREAVETVRDRYRYLPGDTPSVTRLTELVNRALDGFVAEDGRFAAASALFALAAEVADEDTVDLMIDATACFYEHRKRLPGSPVVEADCLVSACRTVVASGDELQLRRYVDTVLAMDLTQMSESARTRVRAEWYRMRDDDRLDAPLRRRWGQFLGLSE